jgi:hypothetical protein
MLCALATVPATTARAADLRVRAPEGCVLTEAITAQVETLTGKSLREQTGVDFEVEISQRDAGDYALRLRTLPSDDAEAPRTRQLHADSCAQIGEAAAVAIAMAITGKAPAPEGAVPQRDPGVEGVRTWTGAPAEEPAAPASAQSGPSPWRAAIAAGAALDGGVLPALAPAVQLELVGAYGVWALRLYGNAFANQEARASGLDAGATFGLLLAGALACVEPRLGELDGLSCVGAELGSLTAEGRDLDAPSGRRSRSFAALRADLGARFRVASAWSISARVGAALPLRRDPFQINGGAITLHRAASLSARGLLGLELDLF